VSALGGDVKWRGVGELVPRRDDEVLVELHQLLDHRDGALARGDVGASAAVLRGHGDLWYCGITSFLYSSNAGEIVSYS